MAAERTGHIVVIQRVGGHTVDQRRVERTGAPIGGEDQAGPGRGGDARHVHQNARAVLDHAGERDTDRVDERGARPFERRGRQVLVAKAMDAFGDCMGK
jgi:hypothetical protein